jgi:hypothetical protein
VDAGATELVDSIGSAAEMAGLTGSLRRLR